MNYMQSGGFEKNPFMRLTLILTLVFLAALWITNFAVYFERMGLTPDSVVKYYLGSQADFTRPRTFGAMLEVTHVHLPIQAVVVLILTHLLIFAKIDDRAKYALIYTAFGSSLLNEASGWLVRFVHPGFAFLKIAAFIAFQAMLGILIAGLGIFLLRAASKMRARRKRRRANTPATG